MSDLREVRRILEWKESQEQADAYYAAHDPDNVSRADLKAMLLLVLERLECIDERLAVIEGGE